MKAMKVKMGVMAMGVMMASTTPAFSDDQIAVETQATVGFTGAADTVAIKQVNPLAPKETNDKVLHDGKGAGLSLDYASPWRFDMQKMSLLDQRYTAKLDAFAGQTVPNYVQVTDQRGKLDGWQLQLQQKTPFKHNSGQELRGAKLQLNGITPKSAVADTNVLVTDKAVTLNDAYQTIAYAEANDGYGTTAVSFNEVALSVPGQLRKLEGNYTSTLVYKLVAAPTSEK